MYTHWPFFTAMRWLREDVDNEDSVDNVDNVDNVDIWNHLEIFGQLDNVDNLDNLDNIDNLDNPYVDPLERVLYRQPLHIKAGSWPCKDCGEKHFPLIKKVTSWSAGEPGAVEKCGQCRAAKEAAK